MSAKIIYNSAFRIQNCISYLFQKPRSKNRGFTLIELLIVVALIGILSTVILANYNSFGSRQQVRNAAEEFKSELRKYQTFAISGQKNPDQSGGCTDTLDYYEIRVTPGTPGSYSVNVECPPSGITITPVNFPDNINIDHPGCFAPLEIRFQPLDRGAQILCNSFQVSSANIEFNRGSTTYIVTVNDSGEIQVRRP